MLRCVALCAAMAGCSFVGVRGPSQRVSLLPETAEALRCTTSATLPSLDALGGAVLLAIAGGGVVREQLSESGEPEGFTKYAAGPLLGASLLAFISASFGNTRITWCNDAKERIAKQKQ